MRAALRSPRLPFTNCTYLADVCQYRCNKRFLGTRTELDVASDVALEVEAVRTRIQVSEGVRRRSRGRLNQIGIVFGSDSSNVRHQDASVEQGFEVTDVRE